MKYLIYSLFIFILLCVDMQMQSLFFYTPLRADLLILPAVFASAEKKDPSFLFLAFLGGISLDFYGAAPFGSFLFSFIVTASLLNWAAKIFLSRDLNLKSAFLFSALGLLSADILVMVFARVLPHGGFSPAFGLQSAVIRMILNLSVGLLAVLPVFVVWRFVIRVIAKMESKRLALK